MEHHGKTMRKPQENHRKQWRNNKKTEGKHRKLKEYHGKALVEDFSFACPFLTQNEAPVIWSSLDRKNSKPTLFKQQTPNDAS